MGKVDSFQIILEKQSRIFISGELLRGNLVVDVRERLKINKLELTLVGIGSVNWTEINTNGKTPRKELHRAEEQYAHDNLVFLAKEPNNGCYLEVGEQSFQFQFQLPLNLPPNFKHENANVNYFLRGDIDIPWAFDETVYLRFTVISHFDLNVNPILRQPIASEEIETLCCLCCKSDPIIAKLSISKTGFVSGEMLSFKTILDNKSSGSMKYVSFRILQHIDCITISSSCTFTRLVSELACPIKIKARMYEEWNDSVIIPKICPSSNGTSKIMKIRYSAVLYVDPSDLHSDFDAFIPIVIGTVPIIQDNQNFELPSFEPSKIEAEKNDQLDEKQSAEVTNINSNFQQ